MSSTRSEFSTGRRATKPSVDPTLRPAEMRERPSLGRTLRALARFLITLCIGVTGTLAWQSYGVTARQKIASLFPRLDWLAPQAAPAPDVIAPAAPSPDQQQLNAMLLGLAALRQSVDQLAAGQERMTGDIAKLQTAAQGILDKISAPPPRPAGATARKPAPLTPAPQATPEH